GGGASVCAFFADEHNGLDHDFLGQFVLVVGAKLKRQADGQVVVTSLGGGAVTWKAGPRTHYHVSGAPAVIEAYLKRVPSILPADYRLDTDAWMREEVRRCVE
ncbi:MAG: hypothetical protein NTU94_02910, partial [Planctomycetota bacterium]|nr:hypothetical protein [Planctomycetota bacterium]